MKTAADVESPDPDCGCHYQKPLEWCGVVQFLKSVLALKDPVLEVTHGIDFFLKSVLALKNVFICEAEIRVLLVADKLHRSSVETIAAYMLLAPTYDLHVVQFYESVVH